MGHPRKQLGGRPLRGVGPFPPHARNLGSAAQTGRQSWQLFKRNRMHACGATGNAGRGTSSGPSFAGSEITDSLWGRALMASSRLLTCVHMRASEMSQFVLRDRARQVYPHSLVFPNICGGFCNGGLACKLLCT